MIHRASYPDFIVTYKCGFCGDTFFETVSSKYKSEAVRSLTPKLHTCFALRDSEGRAQGIATPIAIREQK